MKNFVCVICPRGCRLTVEGEGDNLTVTGNSCPRGAKYAVQELKCPMRLLSTTVKLEGGTLCRCPVRTAGQIPRSRLMEAAAEAAKVTLTAPVKRGQVVISNICGTGEDLIVTRDIG